MTRLVPINAPAAFLLSLMCSHRAPAHLSPVLLVCHATLKKNISYTTSGRLKCECEYVLGGSCDLSQLVDNHYILFSRKAFTNHHHSLLQGMGYTPSMYTSA